MRLQIELLIPHFNVYAFDLRGHGDSNVSSTSFADGSVADVLTMIDSLALKKACVFGHSIGGTIAMLAEQQRPGLWQAIYTFEPVVLGFDHEVCIEMIARWP